MFGRHSLPFQARELDEKLSSQGCGHPKQWLNPPCHNIYSEQKVIYFAFVCFVCLFCFLLIQTLEPALMVPVIGSLVLVRET